LPPAVYGRRTVIQGLGMDQPDGHQFPALRVRRRRSTPEQLDAARRILWSAFQTGQVDQEQLVETLECLNPPSHASARQEGLGASQK
jgi:hypothetical protein